MRAPRRGCGGARRGHGEGVPGRADISAGCGGDRAPLCHRDRDQVISWCSVEFIFSFFVYVDKL